MLLSQQMHALWNTHNLWGRTRFVNNERTISRRIRSFSMRSCSFFCSRSVFMW